MKGNLLRMKVKIEKREERQAGTMPVAVLIGRTAKGHAVYRVERRKVK